MVYYHLWSRKDRKHQGIVCKNNTDFDPDFFYEEIEVPECPKEERPDGWYFVGSSTILDLRKKVRSGCYCMIDEGHVSYLCEWSEEHYTTIISAEEYIKGE